MKKLVLLARRFALAIGPLALLGLGCAPATSSFVHPDVDLGFMRTAAVLPFQNLSDDSFADERLHSLFLIELLEAEAIALKEVGAVSQAMASMRLSKGVMPTPEQAVALGRELGAEALFFGVVEEYGTVRSNREQVNRVTVTFTLIETQTGVVVWRAQVHDTGASFWRRLFGGGGRSLHQVSSEVVSRALETLL